MDKPQLLLTRRRWFAYSLRTLFVLLTVFGVWLGYQLKWIRDRHKVLQEVTFMERPSAQEYDIEQSSGQGVMNLKFARHPGA